MTLGDVPQLSEALAVQIVFGENRSIPRDQTDVGVEVLIRHVKMEGSGLKGLVQGEEPAIDFGASDLSGY